MTTPVEKEYTDKIAKVVAELADNAGEHTTSDCLIDIDVSKAPYHYQNDSSECYAVNTVVLNFSNKCLYEDVEHKIKNRDFQPDNRYDKIVEAYDYHKKFFCDSYNEQDFFTVASFQDKISGRSGETATGGTGLTELVKSLENYAFDHACYILSGRQGLLFYPELLEYNDENWVGFNEEKDFIHKQAHERAILRSETFFRGTAYNFTLIFKKE